MRSPRFTLILAAGLLSGCGFAAPLSEEQSRQVAVEVEAAQSQMLDAARRADAEAVARLIGDEGRFQFNGRPMTNEEARAFARRVYAGLARQDLVVADQGVRVLGPDAAVVSGHGRVSSVDTAGVQGDGADIVWTFVWERKDGTWRITDSHQSSRRAAP